jgi:hypothetical protein
MVLNEISPLPDGVEHRLTTRKCHNTRSEILTSNPFETKLEEKRQAMLTRLNSTERGTKSMRKILSTNHRKPMKEDCNSIFNWIQRKMKLWTASFVDNILL